MSLLSDGVYSSITLNGRGDFSFANLSKSHEGLLKSITKRQRAKFKRYGIVPRQLLIVLWENGFMPGDQTPRDGIKIQRLLDFLREGLYLDKNHYERGEWLYKKILGEELMLAQFPRRKKIRKGLRKTSYTLSQIRELPGTIVQS